MGVKVIVGMSGGVDSSVVAYLLNKKGYDVTGVMLRMQEDPADPHAEEDARRVAEKLGIPFEVIDCREQFEKEVVDYFTETYGNGMTPNPCCVCNPKVKWDALIKRAESEEALFVATGHYAVVEQLVGGRAALRAVDSGKDQTYALYGLTQDQLKRTFMPLGNYTKDEVREMAAKIGLEVSDKPDSMETCFIPDHDYAKFIEERTGERKPEGNFVDTEGKILGKHRGITHYTIGQRKGLGIAFGEPMFVKEIITGTDEVVLCRDEELWTTELIAGALNPMGVDKLTKEMHLLAKIRYNHKGDSAAIVPLRKEDGSLIGDRIKVVFDTPVRAVTPGQAVVFYDKDGYVMGGGTILAETEEEAVAAGTVEDEKTPEEQYAALQAEAGMGSTSAKMGYGSIMTGQEEN